ncbi:MAG: hypothetical protein HOI21_00090 [Bacteroidetes Order II. Incertae sedis bacterium]|jgi:hypothetical protein|nr:hypothetical protein [Bacteroidetes Order II. bacterium]
MQFSMYTHEGDRLVLASLQRQLEIVLSFTHAVTAEALVERVEVEVTACGHPEVTDTTVREWIYTYLEDKGHIVQTEVIV